MECKYRNKPEQRFIKLPVLFPQLYPLPTRNYHSALQEDFDDPSKVRFKVGKIIFALIFQDFFFVRVILLDISNLPTIFDIICDVPNVLRCDGFFVG